MLHVNLLYIYVIIQLEEMNLIIDQIRHLVNDQVHFFELCFLENNFFSFSNFVEFTIKSYFLSCIQKNLSYRF